jgi:Family of unknown function (DUF7019)
MPRSRTKEPERLRTYWYYSDEKIKSLASQIRPSGWRGALDRIQAIEASVPTVGGAKIETRPPQLEEEVLRLLPKVWKKLEKQNQVGTFDEPERFFYGELEFYFGAPYPEVDPPAFFLAGATDRTIIGLGGSLKHVRGYRGHEVAAAENAQKATMEPDVAAIIHDAEVRPPETPTENRAAEQSGRWASYVAGIHWNWEGRRADRLKFEVLAAKEGGQVESASPWPARQVIIGSPIFVAFT